MQLKTFSVRGLFGRLDYRISFPVAPDEEGAVASLLILHGPNGAGKTMMLRLLDGMMRLDFMTFREVPIESAELEFTTGSVLEAHWAAYDDTRGIAVSFAEEKAVLHPSEPGPIDETERENVRLFRDEFDRATQGIQFEFIDIERLQTQMPDRADEELRHAPQVVYSAGRLRGARPNPKALRTDRGPLSERVRRFIRDAQVDNAFYFQRTGPSLVGQLIHDLETGDQTEPTIKQVRSRLSVLELSANRLDRWGLAPDIPDYKVLEEFTSKVARWRGERKARALIVIGAYVEVLESRSVERELVGDRLATFEKTMAAFLTDKMVTVDAEHGLVIRESSGQRLRERDLSSGEFHLLYLMVSALVTQRRGTVLAIDEPEMSMHIAWQRRLIPALIECASNAAPMFILATHSPDIAASYPEALVLMGDPQTS